MSRTKKHGTHSSYSHGCRCTECIEGHRIYERNAARRRRRIRYGIEEPTSRKVDASEAREHIIFLTSKGIGLGSIASQIGTNRATVQYIKRGEYQNITKKLAGKILAVPAIPRNPSAYIDATPIHEMVRQLQERGITKTQIGRASGVPDGRLVVKRKMRVWRYQEVERACKEMLRLMP